MILNERMPIGTIVGHLSAVTAEPGATLTYSLVTGKGSTDNSSFRIVNNVWQTAQVLMTLLRALMLSGYWLQRTTD